MRSCLKKDSIELREKNGSPTRISSNYNVCNKRMLSIAYTPGVAEVSKLISFKPERVFDLTGKNNLVAIVSNGSAVLGLGNIGPEAAIPVMESKAALFKDFANINAFHLVLKSPSHKKIIETVSNISPTFGAINLEDISAPTCFKVMEGLREKLSIPVFHDDQQGAAIVVLAALKNALRGSGKKLEDSRIVVLGLGAAGTAITNLLLDAGAKKVIGVDKRGAIGFNKESFGCLHSYHKRIAKRTKNRQKGSLKDVIKGADVFIGVSKKGLLKKSLVKSMAPKPIVFALANPAPEIMPEEALAAGAGVIATGRSDYRNQINNCLVYPGFFRGMLDVKAKKITREMEIAAVNALASLVKKPSPENIIPDPFDPSCTPAVAFAVARAAIASNSAGKKTTLSKLKRKYKLLELELQKKFDNCPKTQ